MPAARSSRLAALPVWPVGRGQPPAGRFLALVPGEVAPLIPVSLPPGLRGPARLAVARRQVLDRLGPAAARLDLRPAALGAGADGWAALLAVDPAELLRLRAALGPAAERAQALLPDYLALPTAPGLWVLAAEPGQQPGPEAGRIIARLGPADGFAAEPTLAALMLTAARNRAATPPRAVLVAAGPLPPEVAAALDGLPQADSPDRLPAGLPPPQPLALGEGALDLRTDPGLQALRLAGRLRAMLLPAGLALAGAAAWSAALWLETAALRDRADTLETATLDLARRDILPPGPVLDIRLQITREIEARQAALVGAAPDSGLDLVHLAASGLVAAAVAPRAMTLSSAGGVEVDLVLPDFAALDRAVAALRATGLEVQVARSGSIAGGLVGAGLNLARGDDAPGAGGNGNAGLGP